MKSLIYCGSFDQNRHNYSADYQHTQDNKRENAPKTVASLHFLILNLFCDILSFLRGVRDFLSGRQKLLLNVLVVLCEQAHILRSNLVGFVNFLLGDRYFILSDEG